MQSWFTLHLFDIGHPWYDELTPAKTRYPLTSFTWPYRVPKFTAHRGHALFEVNRWPSACFSIGSRAHVRLTCWKQGQVFRKSVNANSELEDRIITFSFIQMFFAVLFYFVYIVIIKIQNRRTNNILKTSPQSYKTQIKILTFPGLS